MLLAARRRATILSILLPAAVCAADEVFLRGGGRVSGVVVERTKDKVVVETGPGRVTLPTSRVERVVEGRSALETFRERAAALEPGDAPGWAALARWAAERDLLTQSREAWQKALAADPSNPEANAALGRLEVDGVWMGREDAYRARGYVEFEGRWVTPAEHEALVLERAAGEEAQRQRRAAELRVREAEARAREAEARAREAETAAQSADEGIPLWWGWGGGGYLPPAGSWLPGTRPPHRPGPSGPPGHHPHPTPAPQPTARPSPPPPAPRPAAPRVQPGAIVVPPFPKPRED